MNPSLHILGGGPAGLAAAYYAQRDAHRRGLDFRLHEAGDETGGNCRTLRIGDCLYDTGAHRLHAKDPEITREFRALLGGELLEVDAPSRIVHGERLLRFPLAPLDLLRNLDPATLARAARDVLFRKRAPDPAGAGGSFRDVAVGRYGAALANLFLLGYTRKLWGRDPAELSAEIAGSRLAGLGLKSLLLEKLPGFRPRHLDGAFLYPRHGIGSLFRALEARLPPGSVRTGSRVTRIVHDGTALRGIAVNGGPEEAVERVISTLPLPAFLRALDPLPPPEILQLANAVVFRNLILCVLRLDADRFSENASLYFPDPDVPFTRLYEPKNRSPFMSPPGKTCIVLEIPCDPGDTLWSAPDAEILDHALTGLEKIPSFARASVLETAVHRIGHAYPVLERGSETRVETLLQYCARFSNLRLAGRNALFRYAHIHDMFRQGRAAIAGLFGE